MMSSRASCVALVMVILAALTGCSGGDTEPAKPVASKACGLISEKTLREITNKKRFYEDSSDGYRYYELGPEGYVPAEDDSTLICSARSPRKVKGFNAPYVSIGATNMDQVRAIRRDIDATKSDDTDEFVKREIREMRRDRSCSQLVTFPKHTGYICDEKAGKRITNAYVVPNNRRKVRFSFYPSIDQSVATPENVLRWANDVDRTIAERDKIAAEEAKTDSKD